MHTRNAPTHRDTPPSHPGVEEAASLLDASVATFDVNAEPKPSEPAPDVRIVSRGIAEALDSLRQVEQDWPSSYRDALHPAISVLRTLANQLEPLAVHPTRQGAGLPALDSDAACSVREARAADRQMVRDVATAVAQVAQHLRRALDA